MFRYHSHPKGVSHPFYNNCRPPNYQIIFNNNIVRPSQIAGKRDPQLEQEVLGWIEAVLGERLPGGAFEEVLRDGTILCRHLIIAIRLITVFNIRISVTEMLHSYDYNFMLRFYFLLECFQCVTSAK